jgi:hypothetical protein
VSVHSAIYFEDALRLIAITGLLALFPAAVTRETLTSLACAQEWTD